MRVRWCAWVVALVLGFGCAPDPDVPEAVDVATRPVTLSPDLRFPEDDPAVVAVEVHDDRLVLQLSGELAEPLDVGLMVTGVSGEYGYLRRIRAVSREGDRLTLMTEQGAIDDAIVDGAIEFRFLDDGALATPGVAPLTASTSVTFEETVGPATLSVTGSLTANFEPNFRMNELPPDTSEVEFTMPGTIVGELRAEVSSSAGISETRERRFPVGRRYFVGLVGGFPLLPGWVDYGVDVGAGIEASGSATASYSLTYTIPASLRIARTAAGEWSAEGTADTSSLPVLTPDFAAEAEGTARVFVRPYVEIVFWGVGGPSARVEAALVASGRANADPSGAEYCWAVDANLDAIFELGVTFSERLRYEHRWPLASRRLAESDPPCDDRCFPSTGDWWSAGGGLESCTTLDDPCEYHLEASPVDILHWYNAIDGTAGYECLVASESTSCAFQCTYPGSSDVNTLAVIDEWTVDVTTQSGGRTHRGSLHRCRASLTELAYPTTFVRNSEWTSYWAVPGADCIDATALPTTVIVNPGTEGVTFTVDGVAMTTNGSSFAIVCAEDFYISTPYAPPSAIFELLSPTTAVVRWPVEALAGSGDTCRYSATFAVP